jgi:plasmid stability protein
MTAIRPLVSEASERRENAAGGLCYSLPKDCFIIRPDRHAVATCHILCYTEPELHGRSNPWQISPFAIDDELLKQARIRAVHEGTSINAVVRDNLTDYVGLAKKRKAAVKDLLRLSKQSTARCGSRRWTREDLY